MLSDLNLLALQTRTQPKPRTKDGDADGCPFCPLFCFLALWTQLLGLYNFLFVLICNGYLVFDSKYNKYCGDLFPRNESVFLCF